MKKEEIVPTARLYEEIENIKVALEANDVAYFRHIIKGGFDVTTEIIPNTGKQSIHLAAKNGNLDIVKFLLEKGANVEAQDSQNATPLHWAAHEGQSHIIEFFLDQGIKLDSELYKDILAYAASYNGNLETIKLLVKAGADINAKPNGGGNILHSLALWEMTESLQFMIDKGLNVNEQDDRGKTPSHLAALSHTAGKLYNKRKFLSYMTEALIKEMRTPEEANNPDFNF